MNRPKCAVSTFSFAAVLVFAAGCLLGLTLLCVSGYQKTVVWQNRDDTLRACFSYIQTQLKAHDYTGGIKVSADGTVLQLFETADGTVYETDIFVKDGWLTECYGIAGSVDTENGTALHQVSAMSLQLVSSRQLKISFDAGSLTVYLTGCEAAS